MGVTIDSCLEHNGLIFQAMLLFRVGWEKGASWEVGTALHCDLGGGCMDVYVCKTSPTVH